MHATRHRHATRASAIALAVSSVFIVAPAAAQEFAPNTHPSAAGSIQYSPYPEVGFPNNICFGNTHQQTSYSADAGMIGNTVGPEEACRFARGETITTSTGLEAQLGRPLDFLVIADHSENLGLAPAIAGSNPTLLANTSGKEQYDLVKSGQDGALQAYENRMQKNATQDDPLAELTELKAEMWNNLTTSAEKVNDPGLLTALIGYEWTSMPNGHNLHRNAIFRDGKGLADQVIPFSQYDSFDAEDLWDWMQMCEDTTGGHVLAIPHGGNLSNGLLFDDVTFSGNPMTTDDAARRQRWESVYEATLMKGEDEAHPMLSWQLGYRAQNHRHDAA